jgi:hypothetical protein
MNENYIEIKLKKEGDELVPINETYKTLMKMFCDNIEQGQPVYMFLEAGNSNSTTKQRKFLKLNVRKIAEKSGDSFNNVMSHIKRQCGLEGKSTDELSSDEINLMFEEIRNICNTIDLPFL